MTTLAANSPRDRVSFLTDFEHFPVIAADILYEGAALGDNGSGYVRPLVSADPFRGFSELKIDNSAGSAGDKNAKALTKGQVKLAISGVAITDVGRPVYATDDDTFVINGVGSYIGRVARYVSTGVAMVAIDVGRPEIVTHLVLPITLAAITGAGDVVTTIPLAFPGRVLSLDAFVKTAVTTAAKAATLNAEINTTNLTGGTVALTSANCTPLGAKIAGAAITDNAAFVAGDTLSIEAASVTAFAEGEVDLIVALGH